MTRMTLLFLLTLEAFNQHPSSNSSRVMDTRPINLNSSMELTPILLNSNKLPAEALGFCRTGELLARLCHSSLRVRSLTIS